MINLGNMFQLIPKLKEVLIKLFFLLVVGVVEECLLVEEKEKVESIIKN